MKANKVTETEIKKKTREIKNGYKKNYAKGYRGEIIKLLFINGFLPYESFRLLARDTRLYQRTIKKLEKEEIVKIQKIKTAKYVILRYGNLEREEDIKTYPEKYIEHYQKESIQNAYIMGRSQPAKIEREIKSVITNIMMYAGKIDVTPYKRNLQSEYLEEDDCFYITSKELKQIGSYNDKKENKTKVLQNSRIMGLLCSPGGNYSVYNIGDNMIEWKRFGESRMQMYIQSIIIRKSRITPDKTEMKKEAIVIASKPQLYRSICTNDLQEMKERKKILMNIDYSYDSMYCIPQTAEGIEILTYMTTKSWKEKIKNALLPFEERNAALYTQVNCDGYDEKGHIYKLIFCIPDLVKLKQFLGRARLEEEKERYEIYCYESQLEIIIPLASSIATIYTVNAQELINYLNKGENRGNFDE